MTKTVIISFQVTQSVEIPDDADMYSPFNTVQAALSTALDSSQYLAHSHDNCRFVRVRMGVGTFGESIPTGNGSSIPTISTVTFDNIVARWNSNWRYINKNASDWPSVSAYTSVSDSYVPEMSAEFPKVTREEIYPLWRNYTRDLIDKYENVNMETFRRMICEHFDGMREDGLRECTPIKKSPESGDFM
jgi:hypothetical protein